MAPFLADLARMEKLQIEARRLSRFQPVVFDEKIVATIEAVASELGVPVRRMT